MRPLRFGEFEIDRERRTLTRSGDRVATSPKAFDLLNYLVDNAGEVVSKDDIFANVWPDQFVEDNNLTVHISSLRKIFGDRKGENHYIITVPGQGYKFIAEVTASEGGPDSPIITAGDPLSLPTNLDDDPLIGREAEIASVTELILNGARLVTLTGAGGTGKTRLAQAIGRQLGPSFPHGVFFIELAAATGLDLVISAIAKAIGVAEAADRPLGDAVTDHLRSRRSLLIFDNFEQLLSTAPFVKALLADAPSLSILVTSRVALHLSVEKEFFVTPLEVPSLSRNISVARLNNCASAALFIRRAQAVKPSFSLTEENACTVAEICSRLDGLPLAIELAAARIKLLSPHAILDRIAHPLSLLTGGAADQPVRQRTMRDTIKWSSNLLSEGEQALFQRLSVFAGGFSVDAAEDLDKACRGGTADQNDTPVLDLLTSLVDNNLLVSVEQSGGQVRLRMLEVVREFALESLNESGSTDIVRRHHSQFFRDLVKEADPQLSGRDSVAWLDRLEAEHDNLRSSLRWLMEIEPVEAGQMAASLSLFWIYRGYLSEARRWLDSALNANIDLPTDIQLKLLNAFALVARHQGDHAAARLASEESLALSRAANDLPQILLSSHAVAGLETRVGNFAAARKLIEDALEISRRLGDEKQIAFTLSFLGNLLLAEGKAAEARLPLEESLVISQELDLRGNVIINLGNLGMVNYYLGNIAAASENFHQALTMARDMGNKILVSCCFDGFGAVTAMQGKYEQSAYLAGAAIGLRQLIGYESEITDQRFCDDYISKSSAALDADVFTALLEQGKAMDHANLVTDLLSQFSNGRNNAESGGLTIIIEKRKISTVVEDEVVSTDG